jgi:hypothetical protein
MMLNDHDRDHTAPGKPCGCMHRNPKAAFRLRDAAQMAKKYPRSFKAPTVKELASIQPGDFVKVCAVEGERFWVQVQRVGREIKGELANDLVLIEGNYGDPITLMAHEVYDVLPQGELATVLA